MRSAVPLVVGLLLFSLPPAYAAETYKIDPVHSSVGFKIKHLFAKVPGKFTDVNGTIVGDPANPEEAKVEVQIKTTSVNTNDPKRDEHLRSAEFFNVEEFPLMTFKSKKVNRTGEDSAFVIGDLTMRGVTKETILQVKFLGRGKDAQGALRTGWEAKTALKRSDFGLTWSKAVEGTQVVGDDVEIELNIEAVEDTAPAATETTKAEPEMKEPATATAAIEAPAVLPAPAATGAEAAVTATPAKPAAPTDPLGALPPGGAPAPEKPADPAAAPAAPAPPAAPAAPVPPKTDAQSGNVPGAVPGAVPGEGSLPTAPNPATPPAAGTPPPAPTPTAPQTQPPSKPAAPETTPDKPAAGQSQA